MIRHVVYDPKTGAILYKAIGSEFQMKGIEGAGLAALEVPADIYDDITPTTHRVNVDTRAIEKI